MVDECRDCIKLSHTQEPLTTFRIDYCIKEGIDKELL
jgi:hypothetical protein